MSEIRGAKKRKLRAEDRPAPAEDEEITDPSSNEDEGSVDLAEEEHDEEILESDEEFEGENPADKRRRLAKQYLANLKEDAQTVMAEKTLGDDNEDGEQMVDDYNNFGARAMDEDIVASRLKQDVAEQQGRVYRFIADKLLLSEAKTTFSRVGETNLTCISCYQPTLNK